MNDQQILTFALASVPTMLTVLTGILMNNARLSDMKNDMNIRMAELRHHIDTRFNQVDVRFNQVEVRLDETKDLWRSELHRVEEILDARLKHIEDR
jgi:hypothetical protein